MNLFAILPDDQSQYIVGGGTSSCCDTECFKNWGQTLNFLKGEGFTPAELNAEANPGNIDCKAVFKKGCTEYTVYAKEDGPGYVVRICTTKEPYT